jgi:hypothetical protein
MIEIASTAMPNSAVFCRWSFNRADGARPMSLRAPLANTAAAKI